ncbi:MAG TPA: AraC family transcriptional regulator, partial [Chitinophaga sp.]|nr:AraC family transcriptional regulator [Chitinophaga sp.]
SSAPVELDPYAAGLIQEIREIRIRRKKGLKKYVGKKVELFMLHYLRLCINARQATYTITGDDIHMIDNIKDHIRHNLHTQLSADLLPLKNNMTVEELDAVFTQFHGISLDDYIEHCRIEKAVHSLTTTKQSITLIASVTGFKNYQAFTAYFTAYFGCAPSRFR